jgi:alpha-beta hydrolase superfamily lysophospholipase
MFRKEDVRFPAEGGIELSAWLFMPERRASPLAAITMVHGNADTKYHGLEPMAEAFAEAGFVVLVHDHWGFGDNGGEPKRRRKLPSTGSTRISDQNARPQDPLVSAFGFTSGEGLCLTSNNQV